MKSRIMQRSMTTDIAPVNREDYIISLQGIELMVFRLKSKLPKARAVHKRGKIIDNLSRLAAIQTDLQKALEL
jgi:hypothetical protein